jgi:hypothetical protein
MNELMLSGQTTTNASSAVCLKAAPPIREWSYEPMRKMAEQGNVSLRSPKSLSENPEGTLFCGSGQVGNTGEKMTKRDRR